MCESCLDGHRHPTAKEMLERTAVRLGIPFAKAAPTTVLDNFEEDMARKLKKEWREHAETAAGGSEELLLTLASMEERLGTATDPVTPKDDAQRILDGIDEEMSLLFPAAARGTVGGMIVNAYLHGRTYVRDSEGNRVSFSPTFTTRDRRAEAVLSANTMHWVRNYYDSNLRSTITKTVNDVVVEQGLSRKEAGPALKEALDKEFGDKFNESDLYWEGVAGGVITRAASFGAIATMEEAGYTEYTVISRRLKNTCPYCLEMDGRIFKVQDASKMMNKWLDADNPEQAKGAHPWISNDHRKTMFGKSSGWMKGKKYLLPPFHFHCWCTIVVNTVEGSINPSSGADVDPQTRRYDKNLSDEEWYNKSNNLHGDRFAPERLSKDWEEFGKGGPKAFTDQFLDKAGAPSHNKYARAARESILDPNNDVFFRAENNRGVFIFLNRGTGTLTKANGSFVWEYQRVGNISETFKELRETALSFGKVG